MINKIKFSRNIVFKSDIKRNDLEKDLVSMTDNKEIDENANAYYSEIEIRKNAMGKSDNLKCSKSYYQACLLGGAIGDALGNPVEFMYSDNIQKKYGKNGITDLELVKGKAQITDDTQMTFFTGDGLLKSAIERFDNKKEPVYDIIYKSYKNWYNTQNNNGKTINQNNGWISDINDLYALRAPGTTCLGSLQRGIAGSVENPINNSKGCGGVMRVAPVGLMYYKNPQLAFKIGAECAALTHGNPSGYLPAGVMASIIANLVQGKSMNESVDNSIEILKKYKGNERTLDLLEKAKIYAASTMSVKDAIKKLGEGWYGDEAIAISVYCSLKYQNNFMQGLVASVNHDGDSDSTGAITGNILGIYLGKDNIPKNWIDKVELSREIKHLANQIYFFTNNKTDIPKGLKNQIIGQK